MKATENKIKRLATALLMCADGGAGGVFAITALAELAAQAVACHIPFEIVEHFYPPIPEQLQLRIAFWSFPESEEDIR